MAGSGRCPPPCVLLLGTQPSTSDHTTAAIDAQNIMLRLGMPWNMHDEHLVERQAGPPPYHLHWCVPGRQLVSPKLPVDISCVFQDFIFNNGGLSVAFIFETNWDRGNGAAVFSRVNALKRQYKNLYVFVAVPTVEQIESFNKSYFKYVMELGCPTFVPVNDSEVGFEMMLKIAHARGVCKQHDISSTMRNEREQAVQSMDAYIRVLTSIPGIDDHDANMALPPPLGDEQARLGGTVGCWNRRRQEAGWPAALFRSVVFNFGGGNNSRINWRNVAELFRILKGSRVDGRRLVMSLQSSPLNSVETGVA
ncbi:hypothetical protein D1007_02848 [Hordeum vulgare]|nr:hypothetical protein D1007_02848 [Hordeum vulgare]